MAEQFDIYNSGQEDADNPATGGATITPHATNALPRPTRSIYVCTAGSLVCRFINDSTDTTFPAVGQGLLPFRLTHVRSTGTAANIVALF